MKTFIKIIIGLIIVAVFTVGGFCLGIYIKTKENPVKYLVSYFNIGIENKILTKENIENTVKEYLEKRGEGSNDAYYIQYEYMKYGFENLMAEDPLEKIYGMTIKELIKEAKEDMKEEGTTVEEFKKSMEEFNNSINEFNESVNEINNSQN